MTVARQKPSHSNGKAAAGSRPFPAQRRVLPSARAAASSLAAGGKQVTAKRTGVCEELHQPRWRAEGARREDPACDAETPSSPPWADMLSSLVARPSLASCRPAAAGSATEWGSADLQWRCACSGHARKLFGGSSLARERREAARAAHARLEAAARQVTAAQSRTAEPPVLAARRLLDAEEIVGAAADAEAALAAAEIRAAVAKHCSAHAARRSEAAQARPAVLSAHVRPPLITAQRVAAVLASSTLSGTRPGAAGFALRL